MRQNAARGSRVACEAPAAKELPRLSFLGRRHVLAFFRHVSHSLPAAGTYATFAQCLVTWLVSLPRAMGPQNARHLPLRRRSAASPRLRAHRTSISLASVRADWFGPCPYSGSQPSRACRAPYRFGTRRHGTRKVRAFPPTVSLTIHKNTGGLVKRVERSSARFVCRKRGVPRPSFCARLNHLISFVYVSRAGPAGRIRRLPSGFASFGY